MLDLYNPGTFAGINIIESPDRPKMQLGERPCVTRYGDEVEWISPAERAKTNAWLLAKFGATNLVPEGKYFYSAMFGFAVGRPGDVVKLANAC